MARLQERSHRYAAHPYRRREQGKFSPPRRTATSGCCAASSPGWNWKGRILPQDNPMAGCRFSHLSRRPPRGISLPDLRRLLDAAGGDTPTRRRDRAIILFLADTDCRAGGLVNLTLSDLDLECRQALVHEKGGQSRPVPFTVVTCQALLCWLEARPTGQDNSVFLSFVTNGRLTYSGLYQMLGRLKGGRGS